MSDVTVVIHPLTKSEFFTQPLAAFPGLIADLEKDFVAYKSGGRLPSYFGCDVPYTQPAAVFNAQLMHIHLCLPPDFFPPNIPQFDRKCRKNAPHKDSALVYVRGELEESRYCILGVLYPQAHAKARNEKMMKYLARLAKEWRDEN
ncbi:type II toxin-antitoxin system YafO family toxin [Stutzerimonas nitrititolerans]|uniref:type II toxin-antitoxin system YafO family toxin n=1 Tax=Stutzerimonas nitrititolerans TaxID=2482751 RepID=UPI0028A6004C|nr:type II toxin-antitoxin system YafO family toxin [Stutzerimonas nitrititolerans]